PQPHPAESTASHIESTTSPAESTARIHPQVSSQLTACQLSCRPVDFAARRPTGSRKRKKSRAGANPVTSLCCQRENFEAFGLVGCK
uniref:Ovule protein n=1 Tax=Macrostomum lignano TaxID=282301 RepID=A0A1I8F6Q7_9PLAT